MKQHELNSLLLEAVKKGNAGLAKKCIERGADVNYHVGKDSIPPLITAVWNGDAETVNVLTAAGANVEISGYNGCYGGHVYPLLLAVTRGHPEIVRMLTAAGADVNRKWFSPKFGYMYGERLLHLAAEIGIPEIVQTLIEAGANVNSRTDKERDEQTPLHYAITGWNYKPLDVTGTVKVLIAGGADVNAEDEYRVRPLDCAVSHEEIQIETVRALLDAGAKPDSEHHTSLEKVSYDKENGLMNDTQLEAARLLIEAGADLGKIKKDFGPDAMNQLKELREECLAQLEQELLFEETEDEIER